MSRSEFDPMTVKPNGNRVLLHRLPLPEQLENGLFLLGREYPTLAKVMRLGTGPRFGERRDRTSFKGSGQRHPIISLRINDLVHFQSGRFQVFDLSNFGQPDWAVMPISELELAIEESL